MQYLSHNILLLGQDHQWLLSMRDQLHSVGAKVFVTHSDTSALMLFREYPFSAVIVDLMGMEVAGVRFGERIHSEERSPSTPVLFIGGDRRFTEGVRAYYRNGPLEFVPRESSGDAVLSKLFSYLPA